MKYKVKTGHMNDMYFVTTIGSDNKYKINKIFFHEENAVKWAEESNKNLAYKKD